MTRRIVCVMSVVLLLVCVVSASAAFNTFVTLSNGYFFAEGKPWVPKGIAYQTWNRPLGVWQTPEQIDYDLDEMVKMGANSIRADFVWQHIEEKGDNQWSWDNYDYLVAACEKRNLRIFALIGYQWPPNWFPDSWYTMHPPATDSEGIYHPTRWQSDIIGYETPQARLQYGEFFSNVCARYKNSKAIAGWIVGNEYGYLGLWSGLNDGYDTNCEAAFRGWLQTKYTTISNANAAWGTGYANFNDVSFPPEYRAYGQEGAVWADAVQWREDSIASFTALGARAARNGDTNHLLSYSTVGMQWGEEDWRYHAEDRGKITAYCAASNAPLGFFSINNYPWSMLGSESQNGHWGVSFTKKVAGVPVVYSETGFTSSEWLWPGMNIWRQGPLIRNALWEALEAGALGVHIFSWMDRPWITDREKGFGIVYGDRRIKPAFWVSRDTYSLMQQSSIDDLLFGSQDAKPDIAFLWTAASDSMYNRFECEMQHMAGGLERLGYEPNFINLAELGSGAFTNYKVIILPRNMRVDTNVPGTTKGVLEFLRTVVITAGVHVLVSADLPGMENPNGRPMTNFVDQVKLLFGVDASDVGGHDGAENQGSYIGDFFTPIKVYFSTSAVGAVAGGYTYTPRPWKYNDETVLATGGVLWAEMDSGRNKGFEDNANGASNLTRWGTWAETNAGLFVRSGWNWQYAGSNMVQMWGDAVMWQDEAAQPFGRYTASAFLRNNSDDPMNNGRYASVGIEWYAKDGRYLGVSESAHLVSNTSSYLVESPNLIFNPGFETNGADWGYTGQLNIEDGFSGSAAETGSYGGWITNNAGDHYLLCQVPTNRWAPSYGSTFVFRVRARKLGTVTGGIKLEIYHPWVTTTNVDITASLTTSWQTFSIYYKPTAGWDQVLEMRLRNATGGSGIGQVQFDNAFFGLTNSYVGNSWVKYAVDAYAPSNTFTYRRIIRTGSDNMLANGALSGTGTAPDGWLAWNDGNHDPDFSTYLGTTGNCWVFWYDGGIYQDITTGFSPGENLKFGGRLLTPAGDRLRNGTKYGTIQLEFYSNSTLLATCSPGSTISASSTNDWWLSCEGVGTVPATANKARVIVRCNDYTSGDGIFKADDVYLRNMSRGGGSAYVDNLHRNPGLVVKNHGQAKSAMFLYAAGDMSPDGDMDNVPDTLPWKWRYDVLGSVIKDYFGVQPKISASGSNAYLCLPEYRTCTNGAILMQIKNYMYDTNYPASWDTNGGGPSLTFTINSTLITGKTLRAFDQGKVIEENSDGSFGITLVPDGQEIIYAYGSGGVNQSSSEGRMSRMNLNRAGVATSGPTSFPLRCVWTSSLSYAGSPVVDGDRLYVSWGYGKPYLSCVNVQNGNVLWTYYTGSNSVGVINPNSLAVADGKLFAATKNNCCPTTYPAGAVFALDANSGAFLWKSESGSYRATPPVIKDGIVYFSALSATDTFMRAVSSDGGTLIWEKHGIAGCDYNGPALESNVLYQGANTMYALNATNEGQILWSTYMGGYVDSTPVVGNGKVYLSVDWAGNGLKCLNATNGAILWNTPGYVTTHLSPALANGRVFVTAYPTNSSTNYLYCFDANSGGAPLWSYPIGASRGSPIVQGNVVYLSSDRFYAFNATNGALLWSYTNTSGSSYNDPFVKNGWTFFVDDYNVFGFSDGSAWPTTSVAASQIVQIKDAPALVHPFGDKAYQVIVQYDTRGVSDLTLKTAFMEAGDNGDGVTNETYITLSTNASVGSGQNMFWLWIPDPNQKDSDYISTPEGGKYQIVAWLENTSGVHVADSLPFATQLKWGVKVTTNVPLTVTKGQVVSLPIKWEDLYETLWWEVTPLTRNSAYPGRVAVYRSSKTESQYAGQFNKVNEVCNWLESLGYVSGNLLDVMFDNVMVAGKVTNKFDAAGSTNGWKRMAGCGNWTVEDSSGTPATWGSMLSYSNQTTFGLTGGFRRLSFRIKADASKTVDKVFVYASKAGTSPVYQVAFYADNAGIPVGVPIVSTNITVATNAAHWETIDMPNYAWSAGTYYHLMFSYVSGTIDRTNGVTLQYVTPSLNGRDVLWSTNNGSVWVSTKYDPSFRIQYTDGSSFVQPYASVSWLNVSNNVLYGQRFLPTASCSISNITLWMKRQSTATGDVLMTVRRWSDKVQVATSRVARASVGTGNAWVRFPFATAVPIIANTQYFFEVKNLGRTGAYYVARQNTLGSYGLYSWGGTNDCDVVTVNTGSTWTTEGQYDLGFTLGMVSTGKALRAWRSGNSDNLLIFTNAAYTNFTLSTDIKYNKQDNYFNDAELIYRYKDRYNFIKVGIMNYYGFWRLKFTVRVRSNVFQQGWICDFPKTNRPVENTWYNLKVVCSDKTNEVYFNNTLMGTFWDTNLLSGYVGVGCQAQQMGTWEPQKGYYFIDDDEISFWAPEGKPQDKGKLLNLDWGYLAGFFPTLILPSTYVMNDIEASNVCTWVTNGLNNIIATDGGVAMKNEAGAYDLGRIESLFGVANTVTNMALVSKVIVGTNDHYVTMDCVTNQTITASGAAKNWPLLNGDPYCKSLGSITNGGLKPALIVNTRFLTNTNAPAKTVAFNFGVDTSGMLTNAFRSVAQRAFEWARGEAYKVRLELKYTVNPTNPNLDIVILSTNAWVMAGSGSTTINLNIPSDGILTGTNLYWVLYTFPWEPTNAWIAHTGFYSSGNESNYVSIGGMGLQILGIANYAYAGRDWDLWLGYNTLTQQMDLVYGLKEKGVLSDEDNWDDGNYTGWTVVTNSSVAWTVTNRALRASVVGTGGYSYIIRSGLNITGKNVTVEYNMLFTNGATAAGMTYRGRVLYVTPALCGWADLYPNYVTNNTLVVSGRWQHVMVNIRDGSPYLMSDLYVDGQPVFVSEPIQVTNWTTNTVGFLSPFSPSNSYVQWDNFRLADEQYSFTRTTTVAGAWVPTSTNPTLWATAPDYDPDWWEYDGTLYGGSYQWYAYLRGTSVHSYTDVKLYFSPRLMIEQASFPKRVTAGTMTNVPVDWEQLDQLPVKLGIYLTDAKTGTRYFESNFNIVAASGSGSYPVYIPTNLPSGSNYAWVANIYPTNAVINLYPTNYGFGIEGLRLGRDDTYRYRSWVYGIEPETTITVNSVSATSGCYVAYHDLGIPLGSCAYSWYGWHDGDFITNGLPEGLKCWKTDIPTLYGGWGIFYPGNLVDLSRFNYMKFNVKARRPLKVEIESPQYTKRTIDLYTTNWNPALAGQWQEVTIPITNFGFGRPLTNVFGSFSVTLLAPRSKSLSFPSTNVGYAVGSMYDGGRGVQVSSILKTSGNGGTNWTFLTPGTNYELTTFYDVDFVNTSTGWVAAAGKGVLRTTDGGLTWTQQTNGFTNASIYSVDFVDANTGWALDDALNGRVFKTVDGGATWVVQYTCTNIYVDYTKLRFANANNGWAIGGIWYATGKVLRTVNGGTTWTELDVGSNTLVDIYVLNATNVFVSGDGATVRKSADAGATWTDIGIPYSYDAFYGTGWQNTQTGFVCGVNGMVYKTVNGGASWSGSWCGYYGHASDFVFTDSGMLYMALDTPYNTPGILRSTDFNGSYPSWQRMDGDATTYFIDNVRWSIAR